jgi:hypothetical protein
MRVWVNRRAMAETAWSRAVGAALLWMVLVALEIALVGKIDVQETPMGMLIAFLAVLALVGALRAGGVRYVFRVKWLLYGLLIIRNIVRDLCVVYSVLFRRLAGGAVHDRYHDIPFKYGTADPESAARRALVIAGVSTSPNAVVICLDPVAGRMRVHELAASDAPKESETWPL